MNNIDGNIEAFALPEENKKKSDDTTGLFVSLYLIVLAFFVVMNSISNQDQNKVNAATESVTRAFNNPYEPEADFVDVSANEEALTPNDEFYEQILGVFASLVGFEGKFPTEGGSVVRVNFNTSDLFEEDTTVFRQNQNAFLHQLVGFLAGGRDSEKREIEIVISSGERLPSGPKYWENITIQRAGAFVARLTKMGVKDNQLSIGIVKGEEDQMFLTFTTRERINVSQGLANHQTDKLPTARKNPEKKEKINPDNLQKNNIEGREEK